MFQIGNERVALVTDTSCDLSDEQLSQYDIRTVALRVATSPGEFRDRLEITQEQLYDLLQREVPKTSLPDRNRQLRGESARYVCIRAFHSGISHKNKLCLEKNAMQPTVHHRQFQY